MPGLNSYSMLGSLPMAPGIRPYARCHYASSTTMVYPYQYSYLVYAYFTRTTLVLVPV